MGTVFRKFLNLLIPPSEKSRSYYDLSFLLAGHLRKHYTQSRYYFLWTVVADRLVSAGTKSVFDIGCGPGQVACLLGDKGIREYIGIDISWLRVRRASQACPYPNFDFIQADIFETPLLKTTKADAVIALEFLEHVERDRDIIEWLKPRTIFIGTVPNFPSPGHVRYFFSETDVIHRYHDHFINFRVDEFLENASGRKFYLIQGRKK